jgi:hypothetical protein
MLNKLNDPPALVKVAAARTFKVTTNTEIYAELQIILHITYMFLKLELANGGSSLETL